MMLRWSACLTESSIKAWRSCNKCGTKHCKADLTATAHSLLSVEESLGICVALLQLPTKEVFTSYRYSVALLSYVHSSNPVKNACWSDQIKRV